MTRLPTTISSDASVHLRHCCKFESSVAKSSWCVCSAWASLSCYVVCLRHLITQRGFRTYFVKSIVTYQCDVVMQSSREVRMYFERECGVKPVKGGGTGVGSCSIAMANCALCHGRAHVAISISSVQPAASDEHLTTN